ncbi:ArnT family glycosyltransferase [Bacillus wiedmannii]|uniref:ArnT family glycosyltransferase n=1 Tax=Bacillus wiedmannii TaxID=1890302 RepID=UPI001D0F0887|nr:glycosyltransferase family 39 protein [Bacillus wiedmannii]MCC2327489.1 glycosyltransferase family 39 protein [Bacillus wiedmannii]MED2014621.1 glycosyltransferase family 39 protein [Bacillus wiedmannii]
MQRTFPLKLNIFFVKCLLVLCLIISAAITWQSIVLIQEKTDTHSVIIIPIIILIGLLFLLIGYISNKYMSTFTFTVSLIVLAFSVRLIWVLYVPTPIESDFSVMYNSAIQATKGDFSFAQDDYYTSWVYQLGFTMYQALIINLFGEGPFLLKLLNIMYCTGTTLLIYKITSYVFNEWSGRMAGLLYALYIPSIVMSSLLTNQHIATFLFYLGFYLLITKGLTHKYMWIFIGISLALGDIMRPLGALVLIAVALYVFLQGILGKSKQDILTSIKKLSGIFIIFYLVHYIISSSFISAGITQYPLSNRDPLWKFTVGLNHETRGGYSSADVEYVMSFELGKEREAVEKKLIQERLADPQKVLSLFSDKFTIMWADYDSAPVWSLATLSNTENDMVTLQDDLKTYDKFIYITTMLLGTLATFYLILTKQNNTHYTLFLLLIIGYITIHFLIEYQTRYRYFIIPSFTIIQSYGLYVVYRLMSKRKTTKI